MKLYKLSQGSTFDNLKHLIYITNEYGKPSAEFIDAFIEQFGEIILNGNINKCINDNCEVELNILWSEIQQELDEEGMLDEAKYTGGFDWFKHIAREGKKLRSKLELEEYIGSETCDIEFKEYLVNKNCNILEENGIIASEIKDDATYEVSSTETKKENKYHYKLIDNTYINNILTITEQVDDISTTYKARIVNDVAVELDGNKVININELIEDAENRNINITIKMGFFRFDFLYKEEKISNESKH